MNYNELMSEFGKRVGLDYLTPNEDGVCELYSSVGTITFNHVEEADLLLMSSPICALAAAPSAEFYRTFLEANFMFAKTRGSTLSVDPATDMVMLSRFDRVEDLTVDRLVATVEAFAAAMNDWRFWQPGSEVGTGTPFSEADVDVDSILVV